MALASGTNFRDVALAVDRFVNAGDRLVVDTPLSVRNVEGLCKDRKQNLISISDMCSRARVKRLTSID